MQHLNIMLPMNGRDCAMFLSTIKRSAVLTLQSFNQLIWPAVCDNCSEPVADTQGRLCKKCWDELLLCAAGDYCPRCGVDASKYALVEGACPNCQDKTIYFDGIARAGVYSGALRNMILAFKARDRIELDRHLCFLANSSLQGSGFFDHIDSFVPVPLHWAKRLFRGYNQSLLLAKKLFQLSAKVDTDLVRVRYTKAQPSLTPAKRVANVAGAFAVRRGHKFSGRTLCLVDDIKTTGATLNECAKTLKQAGAAKVYALVLAVAGQGAGKRQPGAL